MRGSARLVVGFPGAASFVAGIPDPYWLDTAAYAFYAIGTPSVGAPVSGQVTMPAVASFRGVQLAWQSVALVASGLAASNPSRSLVR